MYKIEKNVKITEKPRPATKKKYPRLDWMRPVMSKLKIGNSFLIPKEHYADLKSDISVVPYKEARREFGISLTARREKNGIRVWRVK